jgi:hypothetical protein
VATAFLAATGGLLLWDLDHPERFYMIFTRRRWASWLVRGAFIITGYGAVLGAHFAASFLPGHAIHAWLAVAGLPLGLMTAVYTAYLLAQAKARDLWQSALLPPHLAVQAVLLGSAVLLPFAGGAAVAGALGWILAVSTLAHLLFVAGEASMAHATAHARLAAWEMTTGRFRYFFGAGVVLMLPALATPWIGVVAVPFALLGMLLHEHAYIQAGQAVPLA